MVQCKTVISVIGFIVLLFFGIPIRIDPPNIPHNETIILFNNFIEQYNKSYEFNDTLRSQKFETFQDTLKEIDFLNSQRKHNLSAVFGVTKFSDMSKEEFLEKYLQKDLYLRIKNNTILKELTDSSEEKDIRNTVMVKRAALNLPQKVDWRLKQVVSKINNQRNCGACWAFSTVETIESMNAIKSGILEQLSVQELIDCAGYNNEGCNGGDICTLLYWITDNNIKIRKENEYPLHLKTETCRLNQTLPGVQVTDFSCNSYINDEDAILLKLANHGPVAVAINAILWQNYLGGVIHYHCSGSPSLLNHAVQIVGYDLTAEIPYYIVRNSWGKDFGDDGYLKIAIGSNVCGLANEVVSLDVL